MRVPAPRAVGPIRHISRRRTHACTHARTHARSVVHGISARQALEQKLHSAESLPHFLERVGLERFGERLGAKLPPAHSIGGPHGLGHGRRSRHRLREHPCSAVAHAALRGPKGIPLRPIPLRPIPLRPIPIAAWKARAVTCRLRPCAARPCATRAVHSAAADAYAEYRRHRTRRAWRARGCGTVVSPAFPLLGRPSATCCKAAQGVATRRERGVAGEFTGFPLLGKRRDSARLGALLLHIISVKTAPTYSPSPSEPTGRPAQCEAGVRAVGLRVGRLPRVPWVVCCVGRALSAA